MPDQTAPHAPLAPWFRAHATELTTLDPHAPLDDLQALQEIADGARVVAVGEGAHFVEEFWLARQRVVRFLAERCGFTVLALEFGFSEAFAVDRWVQGEGDDEGLAEVSRAAAEWGAGGFLRWLRGHQRAGGHPLRFAGLDLPEAGGALRPALEPVGDYLRAADPDALPLLETALEISDRFCGGSGMTAAPAWARLAPADQDALTAALARLRLRLRATEPQCVAHGGQERYDIALRRVEAATHADYLFQAMHALQSGRGSGSDLAVREVYLAESVRWHLEHSAPGTRIVLLAHNNHIQKTEISFGGAFSALPMGGHLARTLGDAYRTVALTHTADHVPEMLPDAHSPVGFTLADTPLAPPEPGSVEGALLDAGLGERTTLTDLRRSPRGADGTPLLDRIRTQSASVVTRVPAAIDAVLSVPTVTRDPSVRF
ncbi:erythromycin esterase family protein [Streptomyces sp. WZ-12]|uniref:erythromycin esterase family protein n=1 Tax=Streptomyces sp. WZ-12 TaxID=3030210 RepID=UPI002380F6CB|nr:erythromycin esterase family protein [Streptomyces sp. WZ-12]